MTRAELRTLAEEAALLGQAKRAAEDAAKRRELLTYEAYSLGRVRGAGRSDEAIVEMVKYARKGLTHMFFRVVREARPPWPEDYAAVLGESEALAEVLRHDVPGLTVDVEKPFPTHDGLGDNGVAGGVWISWA